LVFRCPVMGKEPVIRSILPGRYLR
jgi:hypothetical protein